MARMLHNSDEYNDLACQASFRDHPQSELTFSGSAGSKKRKYMALSREDNLVEDSRLDGSARATTGVNPLPKVVQTFSEVIISNLYSRSVEIDALVRFQIQQLQSEMELLWRKHYSDLMVVVEQQATKLLKLREMELDYVCQKNRELEEQVKQMAAESQVWFNYAKSNEAVVWNLRSNLEEVLTTQVSCRAIHVEEGYGDSGGDPFPAADQAEKESATEDQIQRPCRHLCVCKECESRIETCPVCASTRNSSIQVVVP